MFLRNFQQDTPPALNCHTPDLTITPLFIIAGIIGLVCGGIGLAGISIGLNLLGSTALTSVSAGAAAAGAGLGIAGFFSSSKLKPEHSMQEQSVGLNY